MLPRVLIPQPPCHSFIQPLQIANHKPKHVSSKVSTLAYQACTPSACSNTSSAFISTLGWLVGQAPKKPVWKGTRWNNLNNEMGFPFQTIVISACCNLQAYFHAMPTLELLPTSLQCLQASQKSCLSLPASSSSKSFCRPRQWEHVVGPPPPSCPSPHGILQALHWASHELWEVLAKVFTKWLDYELLNLRTMVQNSYLWLPKHYKLWTLIGDASAWHESQGTLWSCCTSERQKVGEDCLAGLLPLAGGLTHGTKVRLKLWQNAAY